MVTVDLTKNQKQADFFNTVLMSAHGDNDYRYFFYGGSIRGGKTFVCSALLITLAKIFPKSRWYVIRKSFAVLKETTIPTFEKILSGTPNISWSRDPSNYHLKFSNGSTINFAGENLQNDPDLFWMHGLECNGFFLEQIEELSEKLFNFSIQRTGSWIIEKMPYPLILSTFNPTQNWVKRKIYDPFKEGTLIAPYYFMEARASDNSFNTDEQWKSWENMDDENYRRYIEGNWIFTTPDNVFAYSFNFKKNTDENLKYKQDEQLILSFDFNVEPITCLVCQHNFTEIRIIKEYRLANSDIFELCERIKTDFPNAFFVVTGDATGKNRQAISKGLKNYYTAIQSELNLNRQQIIVSSVNPSVKNTRVLLNSLFAKHPGLKINNKECPFLIEDLTQVVVNDYGEIDKTKDKSKSHLLDCLRYYLWQFHRSFLNKNMYQSFI